MHLSRYMKNPLFTGTLLMTAAGIGSRVIGFFYKIFLAQTIGAEALGIYQLIAPVFALAFALSASSIQTTISKFVGDACADPDTGEVQARGYLLLGMGISCTLSAAVGILLYRKADLIARCLLGEERCAPLIALLSFSMLPCCIHACINGYYYGKKQALVPSVCQLAEQLTRVGSVFLIYLILQEKGVALGAYHAVAGLVISECAGLFVGAWAMAFEKRLPKHAFRSLTGKWRAMTSGFVAMAIPLTLNRVTASLFSSLENLLIPQKLQEFGYSVSDALSIFGVLTGMAVSVILFPGVLSNSFSVLLLPTVSEAHGNRTRIARAIQKAVLFGLLAGLLFTGVFFILGPWIGNFLFRNALAGAFIRRLSWLCPLLYITSLLNSILHGLGMPGSVLSVTLLSCLIRVSMIVLLVPVYGIGAYLWSLLLSGAFAAIADVILLRPYARAGDS